MNILTQISSLPVIPCSRQFSLRYPRVTGSFVINLSLELVALRADVTSVAGISEVHATSIFRVQVTHPTHFDLEDGGYITESQHRQIKFKLSLCLIRV
jgi:hypothetical protein